MRCRSERRLTGAARDKERPREPGRPPRPPPRASGSLAGDHVDHLAGRRRREEVGDAVAVHVADPDRVEAEVLSCGRARDRAHERAVCAGVDLDLTGLVRAVRARPRADGEVDVPVAVDVVGLTARAEPLAG